MKNLGRRDDLPGVDAGPEKNARRRQAADDPGFRHEGHVVEQPALVNQPGHLLGQTDADNDIAAFMNVTGEDRGRQAGQGVLDFSPPGRDAQQAVDETQFFHGKGHVLLSAFEKHGPIR